jgi:hypothetical protein
VLTDSATTVATDTVHNTVWVGNDEWGDVNIYDGRTLKKLRTIPASAGQGLAIDSSAGVAVLHDRSSLSILSTSTYKTLYTYPLVSYVNDGAIEIDSTRHIAYVVNDNGSTFSQVSVIDELSGATLKTVPLQDNPKEVKVDETTGLVYLTANATYILVLNEADGTISQLSTDNGTCGVGCFAYSTAIDEAAGILYTAFEDFSGMTNTASLTMYNLATQTFVKKIDTGSALGGGGGGGGTGNSSNFPSLHTDPATHRIYSGASIFSTLDAKVSIVPVSAKDPQNGIEAGAAGPLAVNTVTHVAYALNGYLASSAWMFKLEDLSILHRGTPTIHGVSKVGHTLSVTTGSWTIGTKFSYQWFINGKVQKSATSAHLKIRASWKRDRIKVRVTGHQPGYLTASATSQSTTTIR